MTVAWRGVEELLTPARHEEEGGAGGTYAHTWYEVRLLGPPSTSV